MKKALVIVCMLLQLSSNAMEMEERGKRKIEEEPSQSSKKQKREVGEQTVTLLSSTDTKFTLPLGAAQKSETLKNLIHDLGGGEIPLPNISDPVLTFVVTLMTLKPFSLDEINSTFTGMYSEYVKEPQTILTLLSYILPTRRNDYFKAVLRLISRSAQSINPEINKVLAETGQSKQAFASDLANAVNFLDFKESFPFVAGIFIANMNIQLNSDAKIEEFKNLIVPFAADFVQVIANQKWITAFGSEKNFLTGPQRERLRNKIISVCGKNWGFSIKELLNMGLNLKPTVTPQRSILNLLAYGINSLDGFSSLDLENINGLDLGVNQLDFIKADDLRKLTKVKNINLLDNLLTEIEGSLLDTLPSNCSLMLDLTTEHLIKKQGFNCMCYYPNDAEHAAQLAVSARFLFEQLVPPLKSKNFVLVFAKKELMLR